MTRSGQRGGSTTKGAPPLKEGVSALLEHVAAAVDAWRGFDLGRASEPWSQAGAYAPTREDERPASDTTATLLRHWFRAAPHEIPVMDKHGDRKLERFRYWPHQRRFVETVVYLHEVRGLRSVDALYDAFEVKRGFEAYDPWPKLGGQLATGSGKTKMMSLLIAWSTLNALREGPDHLGIGPQVVVIAPGLFVKERLLFDFGPPGGRPSVFRSDPVVPIALERDWRLPVYGPDTCPLRLDPREPALIVTNIDQFKRVDEAPPEWFATGKQARLMFDTPDPRKLEADTTPLMSRFRKGPGLLVLNDEAHHVGDELAHQRFEQAATNKRAAGIETTEEMLWIRSLRGLNERAGLGLQVDLSATLYEEEGGARTAKAKQAPTPRPFRHTIVDYPLREAIADGVVKHPVLERVSVKDADGAESEPVRANQPHAWLKYEPLLRAGIGRWTKVRDQLRAEGDPRKPILFLLCANQDEAQEVANFLTYGEASREDLAATFKVTGWTHPDTRERLFVEEDIDAATGRASLRSTVIQIHIGAKEDRNEAEWQKVRASINAVDHDEIVDPSGALDDAGAVRRLPNPYNVVVSVMMLKEGWDVRNVKVIVPLRSCDSRTLTEQTLGRGLRRMHPALMDEDGSVRTVKEELYVMQHPSFDKIIDEIKDIVEVRSAEEIEHPPEYVRIEPREPAEARTPVDVRFVHFLGVRERTHDWRDDFRVDDLPEAPLLPWKARFDDRDVQTWLHDASVVGDDAEGQRFTLPAAPAFHDYLQVLEIAYALPLLKDIQASHSHKLAVRSVVQDYLERRTFDLPLGVPISFAGAVAAGPKSGTIAVCNLLRPDVIQAVRDGLRGSLREAIAGRLTERIAELQEVRAADLGSYPARKEHELLTTTRSVFRNGAFDSEAELRFAGMADRCPDVLGWLYNHRQGVGYAIEYDWQGQLSHYYPDFLVRVRWAGRVHNLIVEVKGRMDERDAAKARVGRRYASVLATHDKEPWHYLLVHEDPKVGREDLSWFEALATPTMGELLRHCEGLFPAQGGGGRDALAWRLLTRDGIARHIERLAGEEDGLAYAALMALSDEGEADRDRLLVAAEGLATERTPRLRRVFVTRNSGAVVPDAEVDRLLALAAEGDTEPLDALEVVYRSVGA
ncbi:MAG: DEAD/DEAH box helicase family protein [Pseudomonadota bacterium]|nr:DEAD/DEAH box helicase family protein [Pseudomonadota bacterium]